MPILHHPQVNNPDRGSAAKSRISLAALPAPPRPDVGIVLGASFTPPTAI